MKALEIKKYREDKGLTQSELAKTLGVSLRTIQNYEKNGVIPQSKYALLHSLLYKDHDIASMRNESKDSKKDKKEDEINDGDTQAIEAESNYKSKSEDMNETLKWMREKIDKLEAKNEELQERLIQALSRTNVDLDSTNKEVS